LFDESKGGEKSENLIDERSLLDYIKGLYLSYFSSMCKKCYLHQIRGRILSWSIYKDLIWWIPENHLKTSWRSTIEDLLMVQLYLGSYIH